MALVSSTSESKVKNENEILNQLLGGDFSKNMTNNCLTLPIMEQLKAELDTENSHALYLIMLKLR